jgi:hypothetical protein
MDTPAEDKDSLIYHAARTGSDRRFDDDLEKCEILMSAASRTGIHLFRSDICAVVKAGDARCRGTVSTATVAAFYYAMSRIAKMTQYPSPDVSGDLLHCHELISFASQTGKPIESTDVEALSVARAEQREITWKPETEGHFYSAMSRISKAIAPAVAETVGAEARRGARRAIRIYTWSGCVLTVFVLLLSCLLFVVKGISTEISEVVDKNDAVALALHNELQAYSGVIEDANKSGSDQAIELIQNSQSAMEIKEQMQKFATNNRQLFSDVSRTNGIVAAVLSIPRWAVNRIFGDVWEDDWGKAKNSYYEKCLGTGFSGGILVNVLPLLFPNYIFSVQSSGQPAWDCDKITQRRALEINLPLFEPGTMPAADRSGQRTESMRRFMPEDTVNQGFQKIAVYQDIRVMAVYARDIILSVVGAVTGFLLPILYAWLGACAAILRQLRTETSASMFHPEHSKVANRSHVTTAVIVGIAIGLFSDLLHGGTETSPLAIAFVAGYASDKFFEFVDRLVESIFPSDISSRRKNWRTGTAEDKSEAGVIQSTANSN